MGGGTQYWRGGGLQDLTGTWQRTNYFAASPPSDGDLDNWRPLWIPLPDLWLKFNARGGERFPVRTGNTWHLPCGIAALVGNTALSIKVVRGRYHWFCCARGTTRGPSLQAWCRVVDLIKSDGYYGSREINDNPLILLAGDPGLGSYGNQGRGLKLKGLRPDTYIICISNVIKLIFGRRLWIWTGPRGFYHQNIGSGFYGRRKTKFK